MKLITSSDELTAQFKGLLNSYGHVSFAVAWAGHVSGFDLGKLLLKNESKIDKAVIGLHFYQTSPEFVRLFSGNPGVRFILQSDGTFHTKMYLFWDNPKHWTLIVGSSNFTNSGFHNNMEASVLMTNDDESEDDLYKQAQSYIASCWKNASPFSDADVDEYASAAEYQRKKLDALRRGPRVTSKKIEWMKPIELFSIEDYKYAVQGNGFSARLEILEEAHRLFVKYPRFADMPYEFRRCIAGIYETMPEPYNQSIDWKFFGSNGNGRFQHAIKHPEDSPICDALDTIPLTGPVSQAVFDNYCKVFDDLYSGNSLASATRLLAIKRPDMFVCINGANRKGLLKDFGLKFKELNRQTYWNLIVERIQSATWFSDKPVEDSEQMKRLQKTKVAMLDCLYYDD